MEILRDIIEEMRY